MCLIDCEQRLVLNLRTVKWFKAAVLGPFNMVCKTQFFFFGIASVFLCATLEASSPTIRKQTLTGHTDTVLCLYHDTESRLFSGSEVCTWCAGSDELGFHGASVGLTCWKICQTFDWLWRSSKFITFLQLSMARSSVSTNFSCFPEIHTCCFNVRQIKRPTAQCIRVQFEQKLLFYAYSVLRTVGNMHRHQGQCGVHQQRQSGS